MGDHQCKFRKKVFPICFFDLNTNFSRSLQVTLSGSETQIQYLINSNVIKPMCNLLTVADNQVLHVLLDGFYNILKTFPDDKVIYQIEIRSESLIG